MNVTLEEMSAFARDVLKKLLALPQKENATILALEGPLGAGKTTFVQILARELGVSETIQSPTYVLMKSYSTKHERFTTLVHIDVYRLESSKEFHTLKSERFLYDSKTLVCIEWPERIQGELPNADMKLIFSHGKEKDIRQIFFS